MPAHRTPPGLRIIDASRERRDSAGAAGAAADADLGGIGLDFDEVPELLDAAGKGEWRRLAGVFADHPTRFREADRVAVTSYCAWFGVWHRAARDLARRGPTVKGRSSADRGRQVRNPNAQVAREAAIQLRHWSRELALTPDSRIRAGITEADSTHRADLPEAGNPFA